jgi:hypothetical protein
VRQSEAASGSSGLSTIATAFAKSRSPAPIAGLSRIGDASNRSKSRSSRAIAASTTACGDPWRACRRFEPMAMA